MAAYTTIDNPELYFQVKPYSGTSGAQSITLDGSENMQPDLVWLKSRSNAGFQWFTDAVRGTTKTIHPNNVNEETTEAGGLTSFDSDGFTISTNTDINGSSKTFCAWCWKANGAGGTNTDGTIGSHTVSANTTSKFSITKWDGTGDVRTIGHGLSAVPKAIIVKALDSTQNWRVYHHGIASDAETDEMYFDIPNAVVDTNTTWNDTAPTSSLFTVGTNHGVNKNNKKYIGYLWADVQGFQKMGKYTGNGNADGVFVHLGFRASMILIKRTNSTGWWVQKDTKRSHQDGNNVNKYILYPNDNSVEGTDSNHMDILSNGFKYRDSASAGNSSGNPFIYMAWAEQPFVNSKGVPCNAK